MRLSGRPLASELKRYAAIRFRIVTMFRRAVASFVLGCTACNGARSRVVQATSHVAACDSSRAARVALDSLGRLDSFPSAVLRFERDGAGTRIVTWPDPRPGARVVDGMAIVRVSPSCRIISLVQTDSA